MGRGPMSLNGAYKFTYPFKPPKEDLRMEGTTANGVKFYIYDTCVERDPEKRAEIDRQVAEIIVDAERRRFMAQEEAERQARSEGAEG